jgi:hypothetical protein
MVRERSRILTKSPSATQPKSSTVEESSILTPRAHSSSPDLTPTPSPTAASLPPTQRGTSYHRSRRFSRSAQTDMSSSPQSQSTLTLRLSLPILTLIIVVGSSVSIQDFDFIDNKTYRRLCPGRRFLQHILASAFPYVNSSAVLPLAERSLCDALTETCYPWACILRTKTGLAPSTSTNSHSQL